MAFQQCTGAVVVLYTGVRKTAHRQLHSTQMQNKTKIDHGSTRHVWGKRGEYIFLYFLFCKKEVISKANNLLSLQKHKTYVLVFTRKGFLAAKKLESVSLQGPGTSSKGLKPFQMNWGQELSWDTKLPTRCTDRTPTSESVRGSLRRAQ